MLTMVIGMVIFSNEKMALPISHKEVLHKGVIILQTPLLE